jgi:ubiquinone/menaquinone biosynthesis C-methylase UbiE
MSPKYSPEPADSQRYTEQFNTFYSRFAAAYNWLVKAFPIWRNWLDHVLPFIRGPRVLEVSFGTGYLLTRYAGNFETYAVDLNPDLARIARRNLLQANLSAHLQIANVEDLPYPEAAFDSIINTMAFTAYPNAERALKELTRVLVPGGRLILLDINYPRDANLVGNIHTRGWQAGGDIIRDLDGLLLESGFAFSDQEVGGFGSVHLYVAYKPGQENT